jgi:hypothetical protein
MSRFCDMGKHNRNLALCELEKRLDHPTWQFPTITRCHQLVSRPRHHHQRRPRRNQLQCRLHLCLGSKSIPLATHKERRRLQGREMPGPHLLRFLRRMQRIREQNQRRHQLRLPRSQNGGLPASIRVAAQKNPSRNFAPRSRNRRSQTSLVSLGAAPGWWSMGSRLPERQIAPQHCHSCSTERLGQRHQQWSVAIRPSSMRQHQPIHAVRPMQKTSDRRILYRVVSKFRKVSQPQTLPSDFSTLPEVRPSLSRLIRVCFSAHNSRIRILPLRQSPHRPWEPG